SLEELTTPEAIDRRFEKSPDLARQVKELVTLLGEFHRGGRRALDAWSQEISERTERYLARYEGFLRGHEELERNIERAQAIVGSFTEGVYLDAFRKAIEALDRVPAALRSDAEYGRVRRHVQGLYADALLDTASLLEKIGEWDLARAQAEELLRQPTQFFGEARAEEVTKQAHAIAHRATVRERFERVVAQSREAMLSGDRALAQ